jgi:HSP20 family molecular chaperone IbpA
MHRDFMDIWDEMDALLGRLMARHFAGSESGPSLVFEAFGESGIPEHSCGCTSCGSTGCAAGRAVAGPVAEVHRTPEEMTVVTELPGADKDRITLDLQGDTLIIEADSGDVRYRTAADISGAPVGLMQSSFRNGVLEVTFRSGKTEDGTIQG